MRSVSMDLNTKQSRTILLVDDEPTVRSFLGPLLERNGYEVLVASGGKEAMDLFQEHRARIALLLTDVVMPEMSGTELAEQLIQMRPGLTVLFISGFCEEIPAGMQNFGCVSKPFTASDLLNRVNQVLHAPPNLSSNAAKTQP
jgi:CheY-like chemotaxis protein